MRLLPLVVLITIACEDKGKVSAERAAHHVETLAATAAEDVAEIRQGLPQGAARLAKLWKRDTPPQDDLKEVRFALLEARDGVQDLRVAKSTFFAVTGRDGVVLRNDQDQDRMAGKDLFAAFPELKKALDGKYQEATGSMKEAAGVSDDREDGQWAAAAPIVVDGETKGLYVTGWSWASYAYRLEFKVRGEVRSALMKEKHQTENEPLIYVFVVVGKEVYGAPASPDVTIQNLEGRALLDKAREGQTFQEAFELTGRQFGMGVKRVPSLGANVALAVLRSET